MSKKKTRAELDEEAEKFLEQDLSDFIENSDPLPFRFEFKKKNKLMTLRVSEDLLNALKETSSRRGMSYQKYVRYVLEEAIRKDAA